MFDWSVHDLVGFDLSGKFYSQSDIGLGVGGVSEVWEAIQEVGRYNRPPCLIKIFLPKLFHSALGVLGVSDVVPIDLEDLDARDR